jgi:dipeptidyl aminopeptidase/acylaminoacyl peptidase
MTRTIAAFVLLSCVLLAAGESVLAKDPTATPSSLDRLLDSFFAVREFKETAIGPDGRFVAWAEKVAGKKDEHSAIYVADLQSPGSAPRHITASAANAACAEHGLAWAPDGKRLAFLSDHGSDGQLQLYVAPATGGTARKLTNVKGFLTSPRWAPDGKAIAVLFTENAARPTGPTQAAAPETGVIGEQVDEQRLGVVDVESGRLRQLTPPELYVFEYDWSPDSNRFVAIAAPGSGDDNWYIAQLYTVAVATGEMKSIHKPARQIAVPRWSPDGTTVAFIAGLMSDEGVVGGEIFTISATGGTPHNLTPEMDTSASWLAWLPSGDRVLFTEHRDGGSGIATVDVASKTTARLWTGAETIFAEGGAFSVSLAHDGQTCALVRHSFQQPPEVFAGPIGRWQALTHANAKLRLPWGKAQSLHWQSDSFKVQGWLLYPRAYDPERRYPMIVSIHGGPASARRPAWPTSNFDFSVMADQGYFVFFPNPRGSYGQGERFTQANVKDFGHGDLRDILAGVDEIERTLPVDRNRLAVVGWSYGGFMTMWTVTQTQRFQAAVAGAGIANWQSYYGQNGIDQWLIPYFGASVYDDPAVYARSSPINFIKQVRTPTLVLVGERDLECPLPQSYEFWRALRTLHVPTRLVVYPNEGHRIAKAEHRRDIMRRSAGWLKEHLAAGAGN